MLERDQRKTVQKITCRDDSLQEGYWVAQEYGEKNNKVGEGTRIQGMTAEDCRLREDLITLHNYLKGGCIEEGVLELYHRNFRLDIRKNFFIDGEVKHWNRLLSIVMEFPFLEGFQRRVDVTLMERFGDGTWYFRLMVGFGNLEGFFPSKWFCDSMTPHPGCGDGWGVRCRIAQDNFSSSKNVMSNQKKMVLCPWNLILCWVPKWQTDFCIHWLSPERDLIVALNTWIILPRESALCLNSLLVPSTGSALHICHKHLSSPKV